MSSQPKLGLTPEQYLELERDSELRHEYYKGRMWAMSGGSVVHARIASRLLSAFAKALEHRECEVFGSDLRLRIATGGLYTYPDVMVVCGEAELADDQQDTVLNPILLAEVLSPSTEAYDRGFKSSQYRAIPTLAEYTLVSQKEPRVEVLRRQDSGQWLLSEFTGLSAVCRFSSIECSIALSTLYRGVAFEADPI